MSETTPKINPSSEVCSLFPPEFADALRYAGLRGDLEAIDAVTDEMARRGFVRPRHELKEWK
jgi:hypothetical protein